MALPHHNTPKCYERSRAETKLFSSKKSCNCYIPSCFQLPICLKNCTATKIIRHQGLMGLGESKLPGKSSILYASPSRSTSSSIMPRDQNMVRMTLDNPSSNHSNTSLRNKFNTDSSCRVGILQVMNQLCKVLN
uniref:Uncharacterized protein n=1 Tax=Opuntia streptacantha TaxID=393608 RepID=A0A7C9ARB3_OPUST